MDEHNEVEKESSQRRQSTMKKEKKSESRFKFKFESFKKLPPATSTIEKARAFFRSLDLKHHHRHEQPSSHTIVNTLSSFNEDNNSLLNPISPITNISISRIPRVDKINPRDMIVHRVIHNDDKMPSNYFQQKYKQYLKPSLLTPKQYYNDILNKRYQNYYSTSINRHDLYPRFPVSTLYSSFNHSIPHNEISSHRFQSVVCREIESLYNEVSPPPPLPPRPIIRPSSILTWNQCVRRLNIEYKLTIDALEQVKECLEQVYSNSKYIKSISSRGNKNFLNNETKKAANVTFCLTSSPSISNRCSSLSIPKNQIFSSVKFSKPKLVKPVELNTFFSPPNLDPVLSIVENDEKLYSITNIIKKFNNLNSSLSPLNKEQPIFDYPIPNSRVHFEPLITTYEIKDIPDLSPPSELVLINEEEEEDRSENYLQEEETTYTIETFYKNSNNNKNAQDIVVIQENTTEEKFNLAHQEIPINPINTSTTILLDNKNNSSSIPLKNNNNKSISHIPKRIITTTSVARLKQPSKMVSSSTKLKPPSPTIANNAITSIRKSTGNCKNQRNNMTFQSSSTTKKQSLINTNRIDPTSTNRVKSMVHQLNTSASSRPSITNKRPCRPVYVQPTTSTSKHTVQQK